MVRIQLKGTTGRSVNRKRTPSIRSRVPVFTIRDNEYKEYTK